MNLLLYDKTISSFKKGQCNSEGVFDKERNQLLLNFCFSEHCRIRIDLKKIWFVFVIDNDVTAQEFIGSFLFDKLPFCCSINYQQNSFYLMFKLIRLEFTNFFINQLPTPNTFLFSFLVFFVFVLVAIVCQVNHQLLLAFDIFFIVCVKSEPKIAWMEEYKFRNAINKHVASNVKFPPS